MEYMEHKFRLAMAKQAAADKATTRYIEYGSPAYELIMACVEEGIKATFESTDTNTDKLELAKQAAAERATTRYIKPGSPAFELIMLCVEEGLKAAFEESF